MSFFSVSRFYSGSHIALSLTSPALLFCDGTSWPWQFWRVLVRYFVECLSIWVALMFSSHFVWGLGFGKDHHRVELPFSSHHTGGTLYPCDLLLASLTLIAWVRWMVFVKFLHSKVTIFFSPFLHSILWKPDTKSSLDWGVGRIKFYFPEGEVPTYIICLALIKN